MKDTHEMTRLELENEVVYLRNFIKELQNTIKKKDYIIGKYCDYLDRQNTKHLSRNLHKK